MTKNPRRPIYLALLFTALFLIAIITGLVARFIRAAQNTVILAGTPSGEIAFVADRDGTWDVYRMTVDGAVQNLTPDGAGNDYFVSWDFKAERLNFIADRTGELGPVQVQPDGGGLRTLSMFDAVTTMFFEGRLDWDPSWSPDGRRLLWSSLRDLNLELYVSNVDGSDPTRLTSTGARDWFGSWSPDGKRIAFTSDRAGSEDIYVMNADGSDLRQITTHEAYDIHPAWSLDGETLLFVSEREQTLSTGVVDLYLVSYEGDESQIRRIGEGEIWEGDPVWSADGRYMIYVSNEGGKWSLYQRDLKLDEVRRLTDSAFNALFPVWRP
jgi:Tol biopolymer transport system component